MKNNNGTQEKEGERTERIGRGSEGKEREGGGGSDKEKNGEAGIRGLWWY